MRWFGEDWGAPVCEHTEHVPTPVGELCESCGVAIEADDQGLVLVFIRSNGNRDFPVHRDCLLGMLGIKG